VERVRGQMGFEEEEEEGETNCVWELRLRVIVK
jgi:hypothetical protein